MPLISATSIWRYYYYDTPEGEDCFKKIFCLTKWGALTGGIVALHDLMLISEASTLIPILQRTFHWVGPYAAVGASYSALTCTLFHIRKKDDYWNNALAGFASGLIMGAARKHSGVGGIYAAALAVAGVMYHASKAEGWYDDLYRERGTVPKEYGSFDSWKRDFSIRDDPKDKV